MHEKGKFDLGSPFAVNRTVRRLFRVRHHSFACVLLACFYFTRVGGRLRLRLLPTAAASSFKNSGNTLSHAERSYSRVCCLSPNVDDPPFHFFLPALSRC